MKILRFEIRNFKGISRTVISLNDGTPGNVGTLIGLNESGKTTILEALSHFVTEDKDTATLVDTVHRRSPVQDLIPKDKKAAFTGIISVSAIVNLEQEDLDELEKLFNSKFSLVLNTKSLKTRIVVEKSYEFVDSMHKETNTGWNIRFHLRSRRAKKFSEYNASFDNPDRRKVWLAGVSSLRSRLPKMVYFPTFLFDFPNRIYLEGEIDGEQENEINEYYKKVIQDVLDSQGEGLSVQKHIVDRIVRAREEHAPIATFMAYFFGRDEKKQIDAVLQKAANQMTKVIFGAWNEILSKNVTGKRVKIEWLLDGDRGNAPYLEISIEDGQTFSLSERSLGFRWFFSFLLFTQFRRDRRDNASTIFLFDEPAANLHSKPQMKLLESFGRVAQGSTYIYYSTHSHYMVNPLWLERAYIVENKATDYDDEDVASFEVRKTDITAIPYKQFVGSHPTKTTYFQPVIDALDVGFSPLLRSSEALIVEGKYDYFAFFFLRRKLVGSKGPDIFPGNGAGDASCLISLFRGWGVNFRVLLDDDRAGREGKAKYMRDFLLSDKEIVTLGDIVSELSGHSFEEVYQSDLIRAVAEKFGVAKPSKRQFALFFQELIASNSHVTYPETEAAFTPISEWIDNTFR